jgi:hypothetical protein
MVLADELRAARKAAGLSQAELARRAVTSQSAVARYESGAAAPGVSTLERLLAACGRELTIRPAPTADGPANAVARKRAGLLALAHRHGATNVRLFGSAARGDARIESDVDLLVELEPGRTLLDLVAFRRDASALLGRPVDVATAEMLRPEVRRDAERDAIAL